ncbi:MAG: cytochrome c maturation protein CcmE [Paracoccaceae bacterium]
MRSLRKTRRIQVIALAAVALALSTAVIGYAMRDGIAFFRTPSEVAVQAPDPTELFRIGGLVEVGSLVRDQGETVRFAVTDGAAAVPVTYTGILPDLFGEGEGMVAQGRMVDGTFQAVEVLARHDESYMPAEVVDALKDQGVYREPQASPVRATVGGATGG